MKKNKKIKNATPNTFDGIKFRSKLETFAYRRFKEEGLSFAYEKHRFILLKGFEYKEEKLRPITIKPDFVDIKSKVIIEIKGWENDAWPIRNKLFKKFLSSKKMIGYKYFICKNQTEINEIIKQLK